MLRIRQYRSIAMLIIAGGSLMAGLSPLAVAQNDYWRQRVSLFEKLPVESDNIVFLGNSITDGGEFQELFGRDDVINRGIVGDIISGVKKRLDQVTDGHPAKIFLLIGINDVSHGLSAEKIAAAYEDLVKEIREKSPESRLYIQSLLPINNDFKRYKNLFGKENVVPAVNELLPAIAERNGAVFVDLWPVFADHSTGKMKREFTTDGLHLSGAGYKLWAATICDLVNEPIEISEHEVQTSDDGSDNTIAMPSIKTRIE